MFFRLFLEFNFVLKDVKLRDDNFYFNVFFDRDCFVWLFFRIFINDISCNIEIIGRFFL